MSAIRGGQVPPYGARANENLRLHSCSKCLIVQLQLHGNRGLLPKQKITRERPRFTYDYPALAAKPTLPPTAPCVKFMQSAR